MLFNPSACSGSNINKNYFTKLLICLFGIKFFTPYFSQALGLLEGTLVVKAKGKEKSLTIESRDSALLKTKLLIRCLYEKARENLRFDICLIRVQLFCCTNISPARGLFLFFTWFANFSYQFLAHVLASVQNL